MRRIVKLDQAHRVLAMFLAVVMVMSMVPLSVFAAAPGTVSTDIGEKEFTVGTSTEFTITTTANDDLGTMVIGNAVFSDPSAIEKLEYYEVRDDNWYPLEGDFGPSTGFPMSDATSKFRVTFKKAGIYSVEIFIKSVEDGSTVCSTTATALVNGSSSFTTDAGNKTFVVGEATEFTFTTVANEDAGKMVIGTAEFSNPDAIDVLEYYEVQNDTWYPLEGDFGPAAGFPMSNATSSFRVTFKQAGTYTLTAYMKEVDAGDTLCFAIATITVKNRSAISFTDESIEIKYSDVNATNGSLVDSVTGAEYTYESNDENVVKVNEYGILTPTGIGEATITVTRKENNGYMAASATYTVMVVAGVQGELTWDKTVPESIKWNAAEGYSNTVSGGSGTGAVTYSSNKPEIAEVDPNTGVLTLKKPGTVTITATKDGGTLYDDQTASYTLVIIKSEQAGLAFGESNPNAIYVGDEYTNAAAGGSTGGTIMYKSSDETLAIVDANGKVTALRVPTGEDSVSVEITATLVGDDYYEDATPVTYTLTIYRAPQKTPLVFEKGTVGQKIKYGEEYANAVSGGDTTPVTYNSSDETVATVDANGKVTALKAGTVTIIASVPQSEEYEAQTLSYELVIELAGQTVTFEKGNTNIPAITYGDSYKNGATATTTITYVSSDPSVADVDAEGNLVIKKSGTVTITATAAATEQYAEASSSYTITINKAKQTISFEKGDKVDVTFNDNENKFSNTASSNATKGDEEDKKNIDVLYSIASGSEFVVDGTFDSATGSFEIKGAGTVIVTVSFTTNDRYAANMASYTVVIAKDDQTIAFEKSEYEMINGDKSFTAPTASEQGTLFGTQDIIYTIDKDEDDVVSAIDTNTGALTFTNKTGVVVIRATKPTDDNYKEATTTYTLTVKDAELGENVFHALVGEKIDSTSEWYTSNVSIKAADGYLLSYYEDVERADWKDTLVDAVANDGTYNITFYVRHVESGVIYEEQTVTIKKDTTAPEASISDNKGNVWESGSFVDKLLTILTFGLWEPEQTEYKYVIDFNDATPPAGSDVAKVEYFIHKDATEVITDETEIESKAQWVTYNKGQEIPVSVDTLFVLYTKVTDNAGNYVYATTNGIVFDKTAVPEDKIVLNVVTGNNEGFYNKDVEINVQIDDAQPSSGINTVYYEVYNKNVLTQGYGIDEDNGILYQFNNTNPKYEDLVPSWNSAKDDKNIIVDSSKNNSDYVKVVITVIDNAGNKTTKDISLRICTVPLALDVSFVDDPTIINTHEGIDYYDTNRVAKFVITGRTTVFNASAIANPSVDASKTGTFEIVSWSTAENLEDPDKATHTLLVKFNGNATYEFALDDADIFGNALQYTSDVFVIDLDEKPTASITIDEDTTWTKLLSTLTFGLWKNDKVTVKATATDATSPIKKFEMYRTDSTEIMTSVQLDALYAEGKFFEYKEFTVEEDAKFVVYIRVEDYAGHYDYICSDGFVVDMTDSSIGITLKDTDLSHNGIPLYNDNVEVRVDVVELKDSSYSGIKKVEYWVTCDGVETIRKTLYSYEYVRDEGVNSNGGHLVIKELDQNGELTTVLDKTGHTPTYEELCHNITKSIVINAEDNNSCNVEVFVEVTDNAGNEDTRSKKLDIDVTKPTIKVEYNNNLPYKTVGDRGYYPANREAIITITERTDHFDAIKATTGIKIKAVDFNGEPIVANGAKLEVDSEGYLVDIAKLFGTIEWKPEEGSTPDEAVHTAVLPYNYDANYTFAISYADLASNGNEGVNTNGQVTPYEFTIDKVDPTAAITAEPQTWDKLLDVLTFGLFSSDAVKVSATSDDVTSPIESIEYYKTNKTTILSIDELETITTWTDITAKPELEISKDERFVVYLKVTDNAGNYMYINSDGYVVDMEEASITLTPEHTDLTHNNIPLYNEDVDVLINVVEKKDESYSGIKEVKYWVTCDGQTTQEKVLYSFEYNMADYPANAPAYEELCHEFTETVTIVAENNNDCVVVLYVTVTDNAGNVKTESVTVDIDITAPTITVDFDNDTPYKVVDGKGYFPAGRTATVEITERTAHFEAAKATGSIKITAVDATGKTVITDCSALVSAWNTEGTGNAAKHTATIDFTADANYEFTLSYEDLATNRCEYEEVKFADDTVAPRYFAVDKKAPTGTVTAGELGTWDKLIEILTFGLWSKDTVDVTGTTNDDTTPIESVSYYKTSNTTAISEDELKAITSWTAFDGETGITVPADEKFVVYIRIVDYAGNVTYISTDGIVVDDTMPSFETVKPEITITPEPTNGIYNSDVTVAVSVIDPKSGDTDAYAGLKEIRYEIYNLGAKTQERTLYSFEYERDNGTNNNGGHLVIKDLDENGNLATVFDKTGYTPTYEDLLSTWENKAAIVVDKNLNNSNDVKIVVYAVDNAGNSNKAECEIDIDITPAEIEVTYVNNDGDTAFTDGTYFKADRTAKIVVTERNFNPEHFEYLITNTDGYVPVISGWETKVGTKANGDDTTHTATVLFDKDGDYEFTIQSCVDKAMNDNKTPTTGDSLAPWKFTIDKTAPVVSVAYDNNDVLNGNYYKAQRVATITVTEHNFETASDRLKISLKATDDGVESKLPTVSNWSSNGDVHTATITYAADSLYVFDFDYTDKAGNATADIAEQTFYVDKTNPVLTIEKIVDESANNDEGDIGFVMTATDTNFDVFTPVLTAVVKNGDTFETKQLEIGEIKDIKNGKVFTVTNIEADGIYRITCTIVDKAGNAYSEVTLEKADGTKYVEKRAGEDTLVTFSVNRDGSTFEVDENTVDVVDRYYVQNVENDVVIVEINADPLMEHTVTLNGKALEKDKDYTVTEEGGNGAWMKYTYKVNKDLFADEGEYKLVVSSKDKADNDAFSDVKEAAVEFVVDRTAPVVTVSGIANDGRYQTDKQTVTLIPTDDGGALKTLIVNMVDENGKVIKDVINLTGEALMTELEANGGKITFEIAEGLYQNVQIICTDCATGETEETNTHDTTIKNVSVSSSVFMIFWANKPLRWGTIGGVSAAAIALAVFIILKKKKRGTK